MRGQRQMAEIARCTMSTDRSAALNKRYDFIDLMEFIGIFSVLIYHSLLLHIDFLGDPSPVAYIQYMFTPLLSACVPLFFFANGFLLIGRELSVQKHVIKVIQLILLTVVWGAINLFFMMIISGEWMSVKEFIMALWKWRQGWIHHMWYMGALICVYIFFPLIKAAFDHHRSAFNFFLVVCMILTFGNKLLCMLATVFSNLFLGGDTYLAVNFFNMFNPFRNLFGFAFSYFCMGAFAYGKMDDIREKILPSKKRSVLAPVCVIIVAFIVSGLWGIYASHLTGQLWDSVMDSYDTIFTVAIVLSVFLLCLHYRNNGKAAGRFICTVSKNTLGIYLMHEIFLHLFQKAGVIHLPFIAFIIPAAIYSFLVLCLCLIISWILGKIPVLRFLTGWLPSKKK